MEWGNLGILNERLVGGIEQDQSPRSCGRNPPRLSAAASLATAPGGVVREAEVDQIHRFTGDLGGEAVVGTDRQITQTGVAALVAGLAGAASHHIAVHVHRIDRVGHGDAIALSKDVEDVAAVALGAVGDEDLIGADLTAAGLEIMRGDRLSQPGVTLLRAIAVEAFGRSHRIDGELHGIAARLRQRFGHVADAESDQGGVGVGSAEGLHPSADFREQVTSFEFEVIAVDLNHGTGGISAQASWRAGRSIRCRKSRTSPGRVCHGRTHRFR